MKELEAELAKMAVAHAPDRLMRRLLGKAEAENTELQRTLNVKTTDLVNSQDKRASTARACRQQEETIRSLEERVKELSSELSACKAEQEEAEKRSALDSRTAARDHTTALREQTMRANAAEQAKAKAEGAAAAAELCTHEVLLNLESTNAAAQLAVAEARVWQDKAMQEVDSSKDARYQLSLGKRKLERRDQRLAELDDAGVHRAPKPRTEAEWAALSEESKRVAAHRERAYLTQVFESHPWRPSDISFALGATSYVKEVFKEREFFTEHFNRVKELVNGMEEREFGETFGLYLHYEMRLTFDKILRMVQAACKKYKHASDHYLSKPLLYNPYESDRHGHAKVVYVPRIAPPRNKLELLVRRIEAKCGV